MISLVVFILTHSVHMSDVEWIFSLETFVTKFNWKFCCDLTRCKEGDICFYNISGNIRPDGIQAVNIQSLLREKIAFLSGKCAFVFFLFTFQHFYSFPGICICYKIANFSYHICIYISLRVTWSQFCCEVW